MRFTQPFQPFGGESSFQGAVRCSGANGPVPPCVFHMSRGSARCGVIRLSPGSDQPPAPTPTPSFLKVTVKCTLYTACYTHTHAGTHTLYGILISEILVDLTAAMCDEDAAAQRRDSSRERCIPASSKWPPSSTVVL